MQRAKLRAARAQQRQAEMDTSDPESFNKAMSAVDTSQQRIFATLGTESVYEQKNGGGAGRRQFPNQSAISRIQTDDNMPGKMSEGTGPLGAKRQFPKKSAVAAIQKTSVQGTPNLELGNYQQGKRRVVPDHQDVCTDGPMKDILSDVYIGSNPMAVPARAGRRSSSSRGGDREPAPFAVDDGPGLSIGIPSCPDGDGGPRSPAERIKEHRSHQAPWASDEAVRMPKKNPMGPGVQRRRGVMLQSDFQCNAKVRAKKGLPKNIQAGKSRAPKQQEPPSPLSAFMANR